MVAISKDRQQCHPADMESAIMHTLGLSLQPSRMLGSKRNQLYRVRIHPIQPRQPDCIPSIDTFLPSALQLVFVPEPMPRTQLAKLTNGKLHLGLPVRRNREGPRGISGLPARPPSRTRESLPQHLIASAD